MVIPFPQDELVFGHKSGSPKISGQNSEIVVIKGVTPNPIAKI